MALDPNIAPSRTAEETTTSSGPGGSQTVSTKRTEGATQVAQETTTTAANAAGTSVRSESAVGVSPAVAHEYGRKKDIFRIYQVLWYLLALLEILLAFRFFFKLTGANPNSGFVNFIYSFTDAFAGPFLTIFSATPAQGAETTSYFEWSTLIAAAVYALIVWGIIKLFQFAKPTNPEEVEAGVSDV